jgi:RNA polymerase sigma factor (sigma-70 family)
MGAKDRWAPDGNDYEGHGEIPVPTEENVEEDAFDRALVDQISAIAMKLSSQMQTIVCCRFGLNGHEEMTQLEIARQLGISRQAVADAENRALKKIKEALKVETL